MKKLNILLATLTLSLALSSQNLEDMHDILHLCFAQPEMNLDNHLNDDGIPVLVVVDNGVLPNDLSMLWFDNPVEYKTMQVISDEDIQAYVEFIDIHIEDIEAYAVFLYHSPQPIQDLSFRFQQANGLWVKTE